MEIIKIMGEVALPLTLEVVHKYHEALVERIHALYEKDITDRMEAEGMGGTPHFKRQPDTGAYERSDIQMGFIFFKRGYMAGVSDTQRGLPAKGKFGT